MDAMGAPKREPGLEDRRRRPLGKLAVSREASSPWSPASSLCKRSKNTAKDMQDMRTGFLVCRAMQDEKSRWSGAEKTVVGGAAGRCMSEQDRHG